jgi:malonyl-CoA O-methyltransferase
MPTSQSHTSLIANSFSAAATTYAQAASLQYRIGQQLLRSISTLPTSKPIYCIADIGCGTGDLTSEIAQMFNNSSVYGIDLAPGMIAYAKDAHRGENIHWCIDNAENLSLANNSVDLVYSNFTLQWCDLNTALSEAARVLKRGGYLAFSCVTEPSLEQLKAAWTKVDAQGHVNAFPSAQECQQALTANNFNLVSHDAMHYIEKFSCVKDILTNLHDIGSVNLAANTATIFTKEKLKQLTIAYEAYRLASSKLPLSYYISVLKAIKL